MRALVVDKIIFRDIPGIFKIEDPEFLQILLELIATNPGMYIDYQSLSKQFEKDRRVVKNYLLFLKESFLITLLGNYRRGSITSLRKRKKAYPADNGIICLYKTSIDECFIGKMVETAAINKLKASSFWKKGYKVKYVPEAEVYVKNPSTWKDWLAQKVRNVKAHENLNKIAPDLPRTKSFFNEIKYGAWFALRYPKSIKEFFWTLQAFGARLYLYIRAFSDFRKKRYKDGWRGFN